ncbi:hypothetical protein Godav_025384, partial [Gossypium davidsonii]|nr:hypothetical protein [Gossypium davidsonii]
MQNFELERGDLTLEHQNWRKGTNVGAPRGTCTLTKSTRPWSLRATFANIERDIEKVGDVVFSMVEKNGNEMAPSLAIAGINREEMFKAWW